MNTENLTTRNEILDTIIAQRRSHRRFTQEIPSDEMISAIIDAGLHAPYAAAAVHSAEGYFRRFFVVRKDSLAMKALIPLVFGEVQKVYLDLQHDIEHDDRLKDQAQDFLNRLAMIQKMGMVPGIGTAPVYLVIAEKRGFPPVEHLSLAHCVENMWLKATALGLGFQVVSITSQMADNEDFCRILHITPGIWSLMGCATGYPAGELVPSERPAVTEVTTWLE